MRKRKKEPILELAQRVLNLYDWVIDLQKDQILFGKKLVEIGRRLQALEKWKLRQTVGG